MNIKDDFILSQINDGYLVGGYIRDFGKKTIYDRDIAIKNAEQFALKLSKDLDATFIILDSENQIFRLVLKDKENYIDISELQGNSIEDDLLRRDFTINAIAYDLKNNKIIDVVGGINDLKSGILRHIKEENFVEDPLRVLRAFRFFATTGFKLSEDLWEVLGKHKELIKKPAKERINYELMKLFGGDFASESLLHMDNIGILEILFPNVVEMKKIPPNSHHHLCLFNHSIESVKQIEFLYNNSSIEVQKHLDRIDFGGFPRLNHIKLAGFLHDIGKFATWTIENSNCSPNLCLNCDKNSQTCGNRHRFIKHDDVGAKMLVPILQDLKFSKKQINYICKMVKNHIYPSNVIDAPDLNEKIMMRYIRKMEDDVIDNIILAKSDRLSACGVAITDEIINKNINGLNTLLKFYIEKKDSLQPLPKLLDGNEIMKLLNITQSPQLGKLINALKEAQLEGNVMTKDDAIAFVKKLI